VSPESLFLTLVGSVLTVALALYVATLLWFVRAWCRGLAKRVRLLTRHRPWTRRKVTQATEAAVWFVAGVAGALALMPLLLIFIPLGLALGCLEVGAHMITIGR
jgi:hypothetical protein